MVRVDAFKGCSAERVGIGIVENEICKIIKKKSHFFIKYNGFGLSIETHKELVNQKVEKVLFIYLGQKVRYYVARLEDFKQKGIVYENKVEGGIIDPQYILPKSFMKEKQVGDKI
ncbi:hypothetical protein CMI37_01970 [Candidatus Pacearchaeota archaeon]|nr:hypothetical protein [Candidatus Pacearchaeota archaeon]